LLDERRSAPNTKTTTTARTEQTVVRNFEVVMPREEKPGAHSRTRDTTAAPPGAGPKCATRSKADETRIKNG
jgi:hypothetical protein